MSIQNIKFTDENPNDYMALAQRAAELENQGVWEQAMHMWTAARKVARKEVNTAWATTRADYCLQAKCRMWRAAGWAAAA